MPPISAYHSNDTQGILDSIDSSLTLSDEQLSTIAKGFVQEMEEGLGNYGKPMAMMLVLLHRGLRIIPDILSR